MTKVSWTKTLWWNKTVCVGHYLFIYFSSTHLCSILVILNRWLISSLSSSVLSFISWEFNTFLDCYIITLYNFEYNVIYNFHPSIQNLAVIHFRILVGLESVIWQEIGDTLDGYQSIRVYPASCPMAWHGQKVIHQEAGIPSPWHPPLMCSLCHIQNYVMGLSVGLL